MQIGIWHISKKPLDGYLVRQAPAGGTETALVYTAEGLARRGHEVVVFCNCEAEVEVARVKYLPIEAYSASAFEMVYDAFIVVRHLAALSVPVSTRALFYWTHDNLDQPFLHGMLRAFEPDSHKLVACLHVGELMDQVDGILAVSQWQSASIAERFRIDPRRVHVIGNGLQPGMFDKYATLDQRKPIILYSLPPDRGLLPLLKIFSRVQTQLPKAELHLYSRSTIYGASKEEDEARYGELYAAAGRMPGVHHFDPVDQPTLAKAMSEAMIYAYPTTTEETFCISLLEAQAAGLVAIASECGAIPERLRSGVDGFIIPGDPGDIACQRRFADRILRVMQDDMMRQTIAKEAVRRAHDRNYSYDMVAGRLLAVIEPFQDFEYRRAHVDVSTWPMPYQTSETHANAALPRQVSTGELEGLARRFRELLKIAEPQST
jgi:glycosyltransferase involved in cell wall biosynthesis